MGNKEALRERMRKAHNEWIAWQIRGLTEDIKKHPGMNEYEAIRLERLKRKLDGFNY